MVFLSWRTFKKKRGKKRILKAGGGELLSLLIFSSPLFSAGGRRRTKETGKYTAWSLSLLRRCRKEGGGKSRGKTEYSLTTPFPPPRSATTEKRKKRAPIRRVERYAAWLVGHHPYPSLRIQNSSPWDEAQAGGGRRKGKTLRPKGGKKKRTRGETRCQPRYLPIPHLYG